MNYFYKNKYILNETFNRLRIELNKKCVELENKFKNGGVV